MQLLHHFPPKEYTKIKIPKYLRPYQRVKGGKEEIM